MAGDVVQEAFIRAHGRLDQLRDPDAFRTWMYAIVRRETVSHFRRQKRERAVSTLEDAEAAAVNPLLSQPSTDVTADPVVSAELADSAALVWEAAAALDADTYTVLDLHVRQGLSSAEIAEVLDISKGSAYTRLNRTKERAAGAIATYLLVRNGTSDCPELGSLVAEHDMPPVSKQLKRRVDTHVRGCEACEARRRAMVAPLQVFAALAAVPPPVHRATLGWEDVVAARGRRRSRRLAVVVGAALFVAFLGLGAGIGVRALIEGRPGVTATPIVAAEGDANASDATGGRGDTTGLPEATDATGAADAFGDSNEVAPPPTATPSGGEGPARLSDPSTDPPVPTPADDEPAPPPPTTPPPAAAADKRHRCSPTPRQRLARSKSWTRISCPVLLQRLVPPR